MGVITRFVDVLNANINSALDKAEKPEHMLRLVIQEMEEALVEARSHAASCIAEKKHATRKLEHLQAQQQQWSEKAEIALTKGREDLAREALVVKNSLNADVVALEKHVTAADEDLAKITEDTNRLQQKLTEARENVKRIDRRVTTVEVQLRSRSALESNKIDTVNQKYEQLQRKVVELESQVDAYDLTTSSLQDEFRKLETESEVNEQLEALKKKVANA